jgi:hypothetical protein
MTKHLIVIITTILVLIVVMYMFFEYVISRPVNGWVALLYSMGALAFVSTCTRIISKHIKKLLKL